MKELKVIDDQLPKKVVDTEMDMKSENPGKFKEALSKANEIKEKVEASKAGEVGYSFMEQFKETKDFFASISSAASYRIYKMRCALIQRLYGTSTRDLYNNHHYTKEGPEFPKYGTKAYIAERFADGLSGTEKAVSMHRSNIYRRIWTAIVFLLIGFVFGSATSLIGLIPGYGEAMKTFQSVILTGVFFYCTAGIFGFVEAPFAKVFMPKKLLDKRQSEAIKQTINETLVNEDVDDDTPEDLRDKYRNGIVDVNGLPIEARLPVSLLEDATYFKKLNETVAVGEAIIISCMFMGTHFGSLRISGESLYAGVFSGMGLMSGDLSLLFSHAFVAAGSALGFFVTGAGILAAWGLASPMSKLDVTSKEMSSRSSVANLVDEKGNNTFKSLDNARKAQREIAKKDTSTFIEIGKSTGIMDQRRSPFAPSEEGMPVGFTINDSSTHVMIKGMTGSGKTSGGLRPIVKAIRKAIEKPGLLVADGKGQLPKELDDGSENYNLINPASCKFNPIERLDADEVAATFYEMALGGVKGGDTFWQDAAFIMLKNHALLNEVMERPWTLKAIRELITMPEDKFIELLRGYQEQWKADNKKVSEIHLQAIQYRINDLVHMNEKTPKMLGSIIEIAKQWIDQVVSHKKLADWGATEHGVIIEDVCEGKQFGIALPESEFGPAGSLISKLAKKRLYKHIKNRGDDWEKVPGQTRVIFVADEIQNLLTDDDSNMLPIARSLGLSCIFATQNLDGIQVSFGNNHAATEQFIGNFGTVISFNVTTDRTKEFVVRTAGTTYKSKVTDMDGVVDARYEINALMNDPTRPYRNASALRWDESNNGGWVRSATSRISPIIEDMQKQLFPHMSTFEQKMNINIGEFDLLSKDELELILAEPDMAFVSVKRGRVKRHDFVRVTPQYN